MEISSFVVSSILSSSTLFRALTSALLRSLAVSQTMRSQSLGKQIVEDLIQQVKSKGIKEIYLLTLTAYYFFLKLGFSEVYRDAVPQEIKSSTEFSQVCPTSARVMKLVL